MKATYSLPQKNIPQEHACNFVTLLRPQVKNAVLDRSEPFKGQVIDAVGKETG